MRIEIYGCDTGKARWKIISLRCGGFLYVNRKPSRQIALDNNFFHFNFERVK